MFNTDIENFEAEIIDRLVSKHVEPNETELDELMRKALSSYLYLVECWFLQTTRIYKDWNYMRRPWWKFWVSKERFFEEAFKRHLIEVKQKTNSKIAVNF